MDHLGNTYTVVTLLFGLHYGRALAVRCPNGMDTPRSDPFAARIDIQTSLPADLSAWVASSWIDSPLVKPVRPRFVEHSYASRQQMSM